jgi:hypothetical protein
MVPQTMDPFDEKIRWLDPIDLLIEHGHAAALPKTFRTLEVAIAEAQAMLSTRPDVGQFRINDSTGLGRWLVGTLSRDRGYRPA